MSESRGDERTPLATYLNAVWKHKWLVLGFATLVVAGTVMFTQRQPRIYEATTSVVISPSAPQYLPGGAGRDVVPLGTGNYWNTSEYFETQYRILRSRRVAQVVVERLGLDRDLDFLGITEIEDPEEKARALANADAAAVLVQRIHIEPVEESHVVLVKVRDRDPERAARLADAVAEAYAESNVDHKVAEASEAVTWLASQADGLKKEVVQAEDRLLAFKRDHGILSASLGDKQNLVGLNLQDAQKKLRDAEDETARLKALLDQVARIKPDTTQVGVEAVIDNGLIQRLKERLVQLENERRDLLKRYLEGHPDVKTAEDKIAHVRAAITEEVASIQEAIERKYEVALQAQRRLEAEVAAIEQQAQTLMANELTYKRLEEEVRSKKELLTQILFRLKEAELQAQARANNVRILDRARVPSFAVSPRLVVNLSVALVLALLGGLGLAVLVDSLDSSVKTQEQVERDLALTFLGIIPSIRSGVRGAPKSRFEGSGPINPDRYVLEHPHSTAAECVRTVRTNLLFMAPERELRSLLIASAGPREGKTSTSVNIAATMAMSGSRILLIDSDLRRPRLHRIFDMQNDRGLTNLIMDSSLEVGAVTRPSGVEGLDILCTGPIPPNPAELLHTQAFKRTVDRLLAEYDRIIFDSPPLLAVTDAQILGQLCDGAVLVVRANETSIDMVRKAARLLKDVNVNILGALLNNVDVSRRGYGQYYYRYYRRDEGYYPETEPT